MRVAPPRRVAASLACALLARAVLADTPQWGVFELAQPGPLDAPSFNAFQDVLANATFTHAATGTALTAASFYDGDDGAGRGLWRTRFSPPLQGEWAYATASSSPLMPPLRGRAAAAVATALVRSLSIIRAPH